MKISYVVLQHHPLSSRCAWNSDSFVFSINLGSRSSFDYTGCSIPVRKSVGLLAPCYAIHYCTVIEIEDTHSGDHHFVMTIYIQTTLPSWWSLQCTCKLLWQRFCNHTLLGIHTRAVKYIMPSTYHVERPRYNLNPSLPGRSASINISPFSTNLTWPFLSMHTQSRHWHICKSCTAKSPWWQNHTVPITFYIRILSHCSVHFSILTSQSVHFQPARAFSYLHLSRPCSHKLSFTRITRLRSLKVLWDIPHSS